jgi:hypothetical protein
LTFPLNWFLIEMMEVQSREMTKFAEIAKDLMVSCLKQGIIPAS